MLDYRSAVSAYPRSFIGRYVAAAAGALALVLFYQPWVVGNLPGIGSDHLRGIDLARGEASIRVDEASFGKSRNAPARAAGSAAGTTAAGPVGAANSAALGGLTLPTRVPTVAPGGTGFSAGAAATSASSASSASSAAANSAALGGLTLPTRVPTVAPGASSGFSAPAPPATSGSTSSASTAGGAGGTNSGVIGGASAGVGALPPDTTAAAAAAPHRLPQVPLYGIPLAALGMTVFSATWDRLHDQRDRMYGRIWTALLAAGGLWGTCYVLYSVSTAGQGNDLLGPGEAQGALVALWGAAACFAVALLWLLLAWSGPQPPPPDALAAFRGGRLKGVTPQPVST